MTIAIKNTQYVQEKRQTNLLRALNHTSLILSSTLDLETILQIGLEQSQIIFRADGSAIELVNDEQKTDYLAIHLNPNLPGTSLLATQQDMAKKTLSDLIFSHRYDEVFIVDENNPALFPVQQTLLETGIEALALAPLILGSDVKGGVVVLFKKSHAYTSEEIDLLLSITHIVSLAIQNAMNYNKVRTQAMHLAYLNEIGGALTGSLDLAHVLRLVIDGVNILLETERTSVFLIDDANNELVLRYSNEGDADIRLPAPWQGIAGWVARHDQPALVNDTLKDIRHLRQVARETGYETHSILCVPLKVEGRVIGVVQVLNKTEGRQFTHHHQSMLLDFTKWASIALHNAQLYHERVQAYQKLAAEQDRRLTAERRGNMAAIILDMAHTMNNVLGAIRVWASNLERMMNKKPHCPIITFDHQIQHIRKNSEEAIKLIGNITSPIEYVEVAPVDVHVALTYAVDNSWWPDNITYQKDYGVDVPLVMADTKRLETTFHNLLSNAIQAMTKHGGRVVLQTRRADDEWVQITISDTGPGISHELQKHIFDPGVSGRDGGLGVGLWLVETFIHQFGGHIILEDSTKDGTTFVLTLLSARAV